MKKYVHRQQKAQKTTIGELIDHLKTFPKDAIPFTIWEGQVFYLDKTQFRFMLAKDFLGADVSDFEELNPDDGIVFYDDEQF